MGRRGWSEAEFKEAFGDVLRSVRLERRLSQEALAEQAGCHVNHISYLERGIHSPTLLLVFQLADALDLPVSDLVQRVESQME